jgi:hypothetical protein
MPHRRIRLPSRSRVSPSITLDLWPVATPVAGSVRASRIATTPSCPDDFIAGLIDPAARTARTAYQQRS